eukprot:TRINITY_DN13916_c0_g2_i1.p1 TRINITY_DN13916_c0_g2~~TRINITY_DN13916_c0_g2_i1.p1  ORF type:complete len:359 (+),score=54.62 TRINITY_DN13916_c0_g2_i1:44-1120(+)
MNATLDRFRYSFCEFCIRDCTSERVLRERYSGTFDFVFKRAIEDILSNEHEPHVLQYKEAIVFNDDVEYLRRSYSLEEVPKKISLFVHVYDEAFPPPRPKLCTIEQTNLLNRRNAKQREILEKKNSRRNEAPIPSEKRGDTSNYKINHEKNDFERILDDKLLDEEPIWRRKPSSTLSKKQKLESIAIFERTMTAEKDLKQGTLSPYMTTRGRFIGDKQLRLTFSGSGEKGGNYTTRSTKNGLQWSQLGSSKKSLLFNVDTRNKASVKTTVQKLQTPTTASSKKIQTFRHTTRPQLANEDLERPTTRKTETPKTMSSYQLKEAKLIGRQPLTFRESGKRPTQTVQRQSFKTLWPLNPKK